MNQTKQDALPRKSGKERKKSGLTTISLLVALLDRFADAVYLAVKKSFLGKILTAYSVEQEAFENNGIRALLLKLKKLNHFFHKLRYWIANTLENSSVLQGCRRSGKRLLLLPVSSYSGFLFSFGAYTVLVYAVRMMMPGLKNGDVDHLVVGLVTCLVAVPLMFAKSSVLFSVKRGKLTRFLFLNLFGFREEYFSGDVSTQKARGNFLVMIGMVLGLLTLFVSPLLILGILISFLFCALLFVMPEIGVLTALFVLPFLSVSTYPTVWLAVILLLTFFAYFCKLLRGKRLLKIELIDAAVLMFGVILLFSGIFSAGGAASMAEALISVILLSGYFLIVNLMRTVQWIKRCLGVLVTSSVCVAMIGLLEYVFGELNVSWLDQSYFSSIKGRVVSLFENSNVLGAYLVMVFPVALALLVIQKNARLKGAIFLGCVALIGCNIVTWSRGAWIAMLISAVIFFLIYSKKTVRLLFVVGITVPFLPMILPQNVVTRFLSIGDIADSSTMYRVYTWKGTIAALKEHFISGVGYGTEAYQAVYPAYAYAGMEGAVHSHNLFLQILFSMGICGLIVFCAILLFSVQQSNEFIRRTQGAQAKLIVASLLSSLLAITAMGMVDYIWYNYRIFFLFWAILALSCAYIRVQKEESDRKSIDHDAADQHSASLDYSV